jgi:1-acyl-sn-glycerol-3-phosphate acyltransferase
MSRPSVVYSLVALLSGPLKLLYRMEARGKENLPREGGFVLAANHTSNFDPWPLGLPLYPDRFLRFMAKSELFWWPLGKFVASAGAFRVRRGERDTEAIATAVELVKSGEVVVMFPEGTRRKKGIVKKHEARAHTGAARIAREGGVPLLPAAIKGTDRLVRLGKLQVVYGTPIEASDDPQETTERLMQEIDRLYDTL